MFCLRVQPESFLMTRTRSFLTKRFWIFSLKSFVRISALKWADILVGYGLFVMQYYLTDVWKLSFTHAAAILNFRNGFSKVLQVLCLFFVDALLGNFGMLMISSIAYCVGIGFVTMSIPPVLASFTDTCTQYEPRCIGHTQEALFYTGMTLIAVGAAGNTVSRDPFLDEQDKTSESGEQKKENENKYQAFWLKLPIITLVVIIPIYGTIVLESVQPWTLQFGIPAIFTAVATFVFLTGLCCFPYSIDKPKGSPVTNVLRVLVAAVSKISQPFLPDDRQLYRTDGDAVKWFGSTRFLRWLEKAAILRNDRDREEQDMNRWTLCSVAEVEEAKMAIRMAPMWPTFIICGMVSSIGNTYFVEQAGHLNHHIRKANIPLQVLLVLFWGAKAFFGIVATRVVKCCKPYGPRLGIGVAMVFSILCCITAAKTEQQRLHAVRKHNLMDKPEEDIPMSVYWLVFQFFLLGALDSFFEKSVEAFYEDQAPQTMKQYFVYSAKGVLGLGYMFSVLSVYVVGKISEKGRKPNWFQFTLNKSRLDLYYWVLTALSCVNLIAFILVAGCYRYHTVQDGEGPEPDQEASELQVVDISNIV